VKKSVSIQAVLAEWTQKKLVRIQPLPILVADSRGSTMLKKSLPRDQRPSPPMKVRHFDGLHYTTGSAPPANPHFWGRLQLRGKVETGPRPKVEQPSWFGLLLMRMGWR